MEQDIKPKYKHYQCPANLKWGPEEFEFTDGKIDIWQQDVFMTHRHVQ